MQSGDMRAANMFRSRKSGRVNIIDMQHAIRVLTRKPERKKEYTQAICNYDTKET